MLIPCSQNFILYFIFFVGVEIVWQSDKMLELKVAQLFSKVAQFVAKEALFN